MHYNVVRKQVHVFHVGCYWFPGSTDVGHLGRIRSAGKGNARRMALGLVGDITSHERTHGFFDLNNCCTIKCLASRLIASGRECGSTHVGRSSPEAEASIPCATRRDVLRYNTTLENR